MINKRRAFLLLPLYLVWVLVIEGLFKSGGSTDAKAVPGWMVAGFIMSAIAVACVALWYLIARRGGKVPEQRHHAYLALLISVVISGLVDDALKGVAALIVPGPPWWVLVLVYAAGYAVFCAVLVYVANIFVRRTSSVDP